MKFEFLMMMSSLIITLSISLGIVSNKLDNINETLIKMEKVK